MQEQKDSIGAAFARGGLAMGYATLGEFEKADAAAANANELGEGGDLIAQLDAQIAESMVRAAEGQLDLAVPLARECVERSEATGASACVLASSWILGDALHRLGQFADARDVLSAVRMSRSSSTAGSGDRRCRRGCTSPRRPSARSGDGDFDEALATARSIGNRLGEAGIQSKWAESEAASGNIDAAARHFEAAAAIAEEQGARPVLARMLQSWGDTLRRGGRTDEARPILERALGLFDELGLAREAGAVRTVLALGETKLSFG